MPRNFSVQLVWNWPDQIQMNLARSRECRVAHAQKPTCDRDIAHIDALDDFWVRRLLWTSRPLGQLKVVANNNAVAALEPRGQVLIGEDEAVYPA